jgi:hypothetical protein
MLQQQTANTQSFRWAVRVPRHSNGWVPREENRKNTGEATLPAKVGANFSPSLAPFRLPCSTWSRL